jgi:hypothetical protein
MSQSSLSRVACALLAACALASSATAAETFAKGTAVAREYRTEQGARFLLTVTPPADRGVDTRIFDVIEVSSGGETGIPFAEAARGKDGVATTESNEDLVDVSDLHLRLELLSATATCDVRGSIKYKKVNLNGKKKTTVSFSGAATAIVAVYPTKGDVDARIKGPDGTTCDASIRKAGEFDVAACNNCAGAVTFMTGEIENPFSSQASYVGGFIGVFVN